MRQSGQMNYGKTNTLKKLLVLQFFFPIQYFNQPGPKNKTKSQMEFLSNNIVHI